MLAHHNAAAYLDAYLTVTGIVKKFSKPGLANKSREPLCYTDTITGRDVWPVTRTWQAFPGPFGFGGASAQMLFDDLLPLYCEQGARGSQIQWRRSDRLGPHAQ